MDRRLFLKESAVLATALSQPGQLFGATKRSGNGRKVVLVELAGGADGLNMVVPFTSDHYYAARPTLALPARETLRINDTIGLHPALASLRELYDEGKMAIVQGVGYPRPSRCHSTARLIWYSGNVNRRKPTEAGPSSRSDTPRLKALGPTVAARTMPERSWTMRLLGFARGSPADVYTDTGFAHQLKEVARAIRHDVPESVFHIRLEGFDTHKDQIERGDRLRGVHAKLLSVFASGVKAFWNEMRGLQKDKDVLLMSFSEFGRRLRENASGGTDHGTAGPMFFLGGGNRPGLYGKHPGLAEGETDVVGDMVPTVDFRSVYATVLEKWLEFPADSIPGGPWKALGFL